LPSNKKHSWKHKHLLDVDSLASTEYKSIFSLAEKYNKLLNNKKMIKKTLSNVNIFNLFYEPSTRTRASFELAGKLLGANVINIASNISATQKGESLINTIKTINAMHSDIIILRHEDSGAAYLASQNTDKSVINAGDGSHAHPTQALTDSYTLLRKFKSLKNIKITMVGDIKHSRVARSNILLLTKLGAKITLCGPKVLIPKSFSTDNKSRSKEFSFKNINIEHDLDKAIKNADVIMALRMQTERQHSKNIPSLKEYAKKYQITNRHLHSINKNCLLMHPGPVNEGVEISKEVAESSLSQIEEQVSNGVAVRMAILELIYLNN
tara:strand:- start:2832 stop:3803 length:972 start_codon:yes stop_codon:yes gene_type:complete